MLSDERVPLKLLTRAKWGDIWRLTGYPIYSEMFASHIPPVFPLAHSHTIVYLKY